MMGWGVFHKLSGQKRESDVKGDFQALFRENAGVKFPCVN